MEGIIVDNFAGGGGASTGLEAALGRPVDIAVNHAPAAIAMHQANHPNTRHYLCDVWEVDPKEAASGRRVRAAWFSPDCTEFSRAKGGKPRSKGIRCLANVVIRWAEEVRPDVIFLENVEEFKDWGPLDDKGFPIKARAGEDFRAWFAKLVDLGYRIEYRVLVAADYGAPTTRKRFFLVARCDGQPIVWPTPTHGRGREHGWRTASEVIDWSLPCPSIFGRKRPLADATMRRIAAGLRRYVIDSAAPFVVPLTHHGQRRAHPMDEPLPTVTAANRGELALVTPYVSTQFGQSVGRCIDAPLPTITAGGMGHQALVTPYLATVTHTKGGEFVLVSPTLITAGYGERDGQAPRVPGLDKPLGTVVAGGQKHALVTAFLAKHYTQPEGRVLPGLALDVPVGTVTAKDHHSLVTATLARTDHTDEVRAFLVKYYGSEGNPESQQQDLFGPLHTVTTKARFGLVIVHGVAYQIADIGMRMLAPHELFGAQGFPSDYVIDPEVNGRPITKTQQIELAGNSVCPPAAYALVAANIRSLRRAA